MAWHFEPNKYTRDHYSFILCVPCLSHTHCEFTHIKRGRASNKSELAAYVCVCVCVLPTTNMEMKNCIADKTKWTESRNREQEYYTIQKQSKKDRKNSIFRRSTPKHTHTHTKCKIWTTKSNNTIWLPLDTDDLLYYIETRKFNCSLSDRGKIMCEWKGMNRNNSNNNNRNRNNDTHQVQVK